VLAFHGQHAFALGTVIALAESWPDIFSWRLAFSAGGDGGAPYLIETRQRRASGVPAASALPACAKATSRVVYWPPKNPAQLRSSPAKGVEVDLDAMRHSGLPSAQVRQPVRLRGGSEKAALR
jgi:hypothetical protein